MSKPSGARAAWLPLAAGLLLCLPFLPHSQAASGDPPVWWGDSTVGKGFHLRLPVTVANPHGYPLTNAPVVAELDLGAKLIEAGWVSSPAGSQRVLKAFELQESSVRVVAMVNNEPQQTGTSNGQLRLANAAFPPSDPRRFEAPSTFFPGSLRGAEVKAFDARTNPFVSVAWRVPETLQPGDAKAYMVYFDTSANGHKEPADRSGSNLGNALDSLFWSGQGLQLYGQVAPAAGEIGTVTVIGTVPGTSVQMSAAPPGGVFQKVQPPNGFPTNPFTIGPGQTVQAFVSSGQGAAFRLDADKPVLAVATSTGFVPSLDGGLAGGQFLFALTQPRDWEQDTIYFSSTSTQATTVVVTRMDGPDAGTAYTFTMNGATGHGFPYTPGARSGGFLAPGDPIVGCTPISRQDPSPLLPAGPGLYRAQVVAGGPVLLQLQHVGGLVPVPATDGASSGRSFLAATGWSDLSLQPQVGDRPAKCDGNNRVGVWYAAGTDGPSEVKVTSLESPAGVQIDPAGTPSRPVPAPATRTIKPASQGVSGPFQAPFPDRPLRFESSLPMQLFVGLDPQQVDAKAHAGTGFPNADPVYRASTVPAINGPLWGADTARSFVGMGPTLLVAPFQDTQVHSVLRYASGTTRTSDFTLGANGTTLLANLPGDVLQTFTLESTKPLLAYPTLASAAMLAGVPAMLKATAGKTEYRGHLVKLSTPNGLDPATGTTTASVPVKYTIQVTNLARTATGGDLVDTVSLALTPPPTGWSAKLDLETIELHSGETKKVQVTVTPGADTQAGTLGTVAVRATSHGNPAVQDTLQTVTLLKRSFDVGIWFDQVNGAKSKPEGKTSPGAAKTYDVVVQNLGSEPDRVKLELSPADPGWTVHVTKDGAAVSELALDPLATAALKLRVQPPAALADGLLLSTVTARSVSSPGDAFDRVSATTILRQPANLELEVEDDQAYADPGEEALFRVLLRNRGGGSADVSLDLQSDAPASWVPPKVFLLDPASGERVPVTRFSIGAEEVELFVNATPSELERAGKTASLRLEAFSADRTAQAAQVLRVSVRAVHRLEATTAALPVAVPPGSNTTLLISLENRGNLDEVLALAPANLPAGWVLLAPKDVALARNATQSFAVSLLTPRGVPTGDYNVTLGLRSRDGNLTVVPLTSRVAVFGEGSAGALLPVLAQPGRAAMVAIPVSNRGNVPLTVLAERPDGEPWPKAGSPPPLVLAPGANGTVDYGWTVPVDALDGTTVHAVTLVLQPEDVNAQTRLETVSVRIEVGRPDLAVGEAKAYPGAAGTLVAVSVFNAGQRDAIGARVHLLDGDEVADAITIDLLPAGEHANVTLLFAGATPGGLVVSVDAENDVVELDEANNQVAVTPPSAKAAPAAQALFLVVLLAFVAMVRRSTGQDRD